MTFERELATFRFLLGYGQTLLADVSEEEMTAQPTAGMNHPAWVIGHLAIAFDRHGEYVGAERLLTDWDAQFGMGTEPKADRDAYMDKAGLVAAWVSSAERYAQAVAAADPKAFELETEGPLAGPFPTVGDFLTFSLTGHTSIHLGQLSAWRKAMGRPAMF